MEAEFDIPDAPWVALAESVSIAAAVSPALLRRARVELHPELGPDAEGMVWMSSLVERRTSAYCWFHPTIAQQLQQRLQQRQGVEQAWMRLEPVLRQESPLGLLEAELYYRSLTRRNHPNEAASLLRRVIVSAVENPGIPGWAIRVLSMLGDSSEGVEGWALRLLAQTVLQTPHRGHRSPPAELFDLPWERLLPADLPTVTIGVVWNPGHSSLCFSSQPTSSFATIKIPRTWPLVLFVDHESWDADSGRTVATRRGVTLTDAGDTSIQVSHDSVRILTLDRRVYTLRRIRRQQAEPSRLLLPELQKHMWQAVALVRDWTEAGNYKHLILALLFYKRLCDLAEEQDEGEGSLPDERRFQIPLSCRWRKVRGNPTDVGGALGAALRGIEEANPVLRGVFQYVNIATQEWLPDDVLDALMHHFEGLRLRNEDVGARILGEAFDYLITKFAELQGKRGADFYTPRQVTKLMVEILRPNERMSVYDPACGAGGMLLEVARYIERNLGNPRRLRLSGQEINLNTWALCKMHVALHDLNASIERGDTLRRPAHLFAESAVAQFDLVLSNPPFSLSDWGHEGWREGDPYGRDIYGCPPRHNGDMAFIQHMLASLTSTGRMATVCSHGMLFRGGSDGKVRRGLVEDDLIEAVIGLAGNLFYGTSVPTAVLVLNRNKAPERQGKVLLVNGDKEYVPGIAQNCLSDDNVARLVEAFHRFEDKNYYCRVVSVDELRAQDFSLALNRYVHTDPPPSSINVGEVVSELQKLMVKRDAAELLMLARLRRLGLDD